MKPAGFQENWENAYQALTECASRLMELFALALDLPESWFEPYFQRPISAMRANHYPVAEHPHQPGQFRASAHSDYGSLTLLLQDRGGSGLEILNRQQQWIPINCTNPEIVVNIGDLMERWTNGLWVSSLHRVILPESREERIKPRMSLVFSSSPTGMPGSNACLPASGPMEHNTRR